MCSSDLLKSVSIEGAHYMLLDENGRAFENDELTPGDDFEGLTERITTEKLGDHAGMYDDGTMLYYYVQSKKTGWHHVVYVRREAIIGSMLYEMMEYILRASAILLLAMLAMAGLFSRALSRPVNKLVAAVRQIEGGVFGQEIEYTSANEMGYLVEQFNKMSLSIQRLIRENYQVRLREKDTEIMSLTTQFNPHYIYNTLNAIHWCAVRGNAREAANMIKSLALMMRYTSDQKQECTRLWDDIEWMTRYLLLLEARHGDLFRTKWKIDPKLMDMLVPKLFLQPLVENCVLHGFKDIETGGLITIEGHGVGDALKFSVMDNGCGMTKAEVEALLDGGEHSSIGLINVQRRIQLICGPDYGLHIASEVGVGTCITVIISKESAIN